MKTQAMIANRPTSPTNTSSHASNAYARASMPRLPRVKPHVCVPCRADGKPYVGRAHNQNNAFFAAGHWSEGIHYGPLTGQWLADTITTGSSDIDFSAIGTDRLPNFG